MHSLFDKNSFYELVTRKGHHGLEYIHEHLCTLTRLAQQCDTVAEFGTSWGASAGAFLLAEPKVFLTVDIFTADLIKKLLASQENFKTKIVVWRGNTLDLKLKRVDLLFIDSWHTYTQLSKELKLHAHKVNKYIVLHDTTNYEFKDEPNLFNLKEEKGKYEGLWPAVREFLDQGHWEIAERYIHGCGLTVLRRRDDVKKLF